MVFGKMRINKSSHSEERVFSQKISSINPENRMEMGVIGSKTLISLQKRDLFL